MSGGRFLVSLREVKATERILTCRSLLKAGVNYWEENDKNHCNNSEAISEFMEKLEEHEGELFEVALCDDSIEVAQCIAGYAAKKLMKKFCVDCCDYLVQNGGNKEENYLKLLSRGGLIMPSKNLASMVACLFAQVEYVDSAMDCNTVRKFAQIALEKYAPEEEISCEVHRKRNRSAIISTVINHFYNNMQKLAADSVRKEAIVYFKKRQRKKVE